MAEKLKYLDGLRGVASFIVVIDHFLAFFYPAFFNASPQSVHTSRGWEILLAKSPLNILWDGHLSVCIFFVLSGYVLTYRFFASKEPRVITSSAAKRYLRLMIPVLATMFLTYSFMELGLFANARAAALTTAADFATFFTFEPNFWAMLKQATYTVFFRNETFYYVSLWTMTIELLGSFLVYGLALIFGKLPKRWIFFLVTAFVFRNDYYLAFVLGMMLGDFFHGGYRLAEKLKTTPFVLLFSALGLLFGTFPLVDPAGTFYQRLTVLQLPNHIVGAFFIMLALLCSTRLKKFFSLPFIHYLGRLSFSIYLTQLTVLCSLSAWAFLFFHGFMRYNYAALLTFAITIPVVLIASHFYTRYIDESGIKISKWVYDTFLNRKAEPLPEATAAAEGAAAPLG